MKIKSKISVILIICFILLNMCTSVFAIEYKTIETNSKEINKITNTDIIQETPKTSTSRGIAKYSLKYQGNLIENKNETSKTYVNRNGYNYTYSRVNWSNFIEIKRYCFETEEYKTIFDNLGKFDVQTVCGYYVLDKVIYTAIYSTTQYDELRIIGYDTQTETLIYDKTFPIAYDDYFGEFCVDSSQNMYFVLNGNIDTELSIETYDKTGNKIDSVTKTFLDGNYDYLDLTGVDSGSRVLFFSLRVTNGNLYYSDDYIIRTSNGRFLNNKEVYLVRKYGGCAWTFLDDSQTHAYSQYGEFFEIDYNADNEAGLSYTLKKKISVDGTYVYMGYLSSSDDKYVYLGTEQGLLYILNWNTYNIEKTLSIGEDKTIVGVYKTDGDNILIEYYNGTDQNYYALTLNISDYNTPQENIEITNHTSLEHMKAQIKSKYKELSIVNTTTDLYQIEPSVTSPYVAGSLKTQVKTDTINQINYFRWLSGLGGVTQNDEYMESSQKGAVVLAANAISLGNYNYLTHFPSKPSDMTDDFYIPGYKATSAGFGTSANVSSGALMAQSVKGYVDDTNNIEPNVGHRLSLLDPKAVTTSFGFAGRHSVINIFSDRTIVNVDSYYSWPSPGYFPVESMEAGAMWSITLPSPEYNISDTTKVVLKANGKQYSSDNNDFTLYFESYYNTYYFDIPNELKKYLVDETNMIQNGKKVEVEVYGLSDNLGNTYVVKYPVNFFSLDKALTGITLPKTATLKIGTTDTFELTNIPEGKITWSSSDSNIISIDDNGTMTAKSIGKAIITAEIDGVTTACSVTVTDKMIGDVNGDGKITLSDYTKILSHVKKTQLLTDGALLSADVNCDGKVTLSDYTKVLAHVKKTALLY